MQYLKLTLTLLALAFTILACSEETAPNPNPPTNPGPTEPTNPTDPPGPTDPDPDPLPNPVPNPDNEPNLNFKGDAQAYLKGDWSEVVDWPFIAIHSALLPDGKVMTYGTGPDGSGEAFSYDVWNPKEGLGQASHNTLAVQTGTDIFCSAQAIVPGTGEMLLAGGTTDIPNSIEDGSSADTNFFNLEDYTMRKSPRQMLEGRWYPTVTTLANGEVLVHGGRSFPETPVIMPEVYNAETGWRNLTDAEDGAGGYKDTYEDAYYSWYYPWSFVAPDGRVFFTNNNPNMWFLDTEGEGELEYAGRRPDGIWRGSATAALYDEGKLLAVGGQNKDERGVEVSTNTTLLIDISGGEAEVTEAEPMTYARSEHDLTVLPDGTVLASGGSAVRNELVDVALEPEVWNPNTGKWELLKGNTTPRLYHSTTLLLSDGTLLMAGGGRPGPITESGAELTNTNGELFYPPYLFAKDGSGNLAPRPRVLSIAQPEYGQTFDVEVSDDVERVTLVRAGSTTHAFNMEQRFVELEFTKNGNTLSAAAPERPELAPPGNYLLFVLDEDGVPSYGEMVTLGL